MMKLKLQLSLYLMTTLDWYVKEGYIKRNRFIAESIKNHLDYVTTGPGSNTASPSVELEVRIPAFLALRLWWKALKNKTSISSIANEALAFSLPTLMEEYKKEK